MSEFREILAANVFVLINLIVLEYNTSCGFVVGTRGHKESVTTVLPRKSSSTPKPSSKSSDSSSDEQSFPIPCLDSQNRTVENGFCVAFGTCVFYRRKGLESEERCPHDHECCFGRGALSCNGHNGDCVSKHHCKTMSFPLSEECNRPNEVCCVRLDRQDQLLAEVKRDGSMLAQGYPKQAVATETSKHKATTEKSHHVHESKTEKSRHGHAETTEKSKHGHAETTEKSKHGHPGTTEKSDHGHKASTEKSSREHEGSREKSKDEHEGTTEKPNDDNEDTGPDETTKTTEHGHDGATEKPEHEYEETTEKSNHEHQDPEE